MKALHAYKIDRTEKRKRVQINTGSESRVRQSEHEATKIDNILKKYAATGVLPIQRRQGFFADVSGLCDYKEALDLLHDKGDVFRKLPKEARELLMSDPEEFRKIIMEETNRENLEKIGLLEPIEKEPVKEETPPAPGAAEGAATPPEGGEAQS